MMDLRKKNSPNICIRQKLLLRKLNDFYNNKTHLDELLPLINGETKISLRIIDWFVTNYSKKNNIIISKNYGLQNVNTDTDNNDIDTNDKDTNDKDTNDKNKKEYIDLLENIKKSKKNKDEINIFLNYKSQLKAYSKKQFDPFCRRERLNYYYGDSDTDFIVTTIGQLNFFRWAIENNIIEFIKNNLNEIELDMNTNIKTDSKKSKKKLDLTETKKRKKRRELSVAATRTLNKHITPILLDFN